MVIMNIRVVPHLLCFLLTATSAWAKRAAPTPVAPVQSGPIEYRVSKQMLGCVEAWEGTPKECLWTRQVYVVKVIPALEKDIQDVHISDLSLKDGALWIKNEAGSTYTLQLDSLEITVIQGHLVESFRR